MIALTYVLPMFPHWTLQLSALVAVVFVAAGIGGATTDTAQSPGPPSEPKLVGCTSATVNAIAGGGPGNSWIVGAEGCHPVQGTVVWRELSSGLSAGCSTQLGVPCTSATGVPLYECVIVEAQVLFLGQVAATDVDHACKA